MISFLLLISHFILSYTYDIPFETALSLIESNFNGETSLDYSFYYPIGNFDLIIDNIFPTVSYLEKEILYNNSVCYYDYSIVYIFNIQFTTRDTPIVNVTKKGSAYFLYDKMILTYQSDFSFVFYTPLYLKKEYIDIGEFKDFALFDVVLIDDQLETSLSVSYELILKEMLEKTPTCYVMKVYEYISDYIARYKKFKVTECPGLLSEEVKITNLKFDFKKKLSDLSMQFFNICMLVEYRNKLGLRVTKVCNDNIVISKESIVYGNFRTLNEDVVCIVKYVFDFLYSTFSD